MTGRDVRRGQRWRSGGLPARPAASKAGFTLAEMLVATAILALIIGILFAVVQGTSKVWKRTSGKVEAFRGARTAFEAVTRTLSQATLNTYYDYIYGVSGNQWVFPNSSPPPTATVPIGFGRNSDLEIVSGQANSTTMLTSSIGAFTPVTHAVFFQAPLNLVGSSVDANMTGLLNACGFFVMYGPDYAQPSFLPSTQRYRYRLIQFLQPAEKLSIYTSGNRGTDLWYYPFVKTDFKTASAVPSADFVLADNVIALVILPKLSSKDEQAAATAYGISPAAGTALAPNYSYDSALIGQGGTLNATTGKSTYPLLNSLNQMPPVFQVTMVAIDEASAVKLGNTTTPPSAKIGLTSPTTLFTTASNFQADLQTLENDLSAKPGNTAGNKIPLNFEVFQTDVAVRGAKWTGND